MPLREVQVNEPVASRRIVYFHLVQTNGLDPANDEDGGQPQASVDGAAWSDAPIGTLTLIGNGRYYAYLTEAAVSSLGSNVETRYKSPRTAECPGDSVKVVSYNPDNGPQPAGNGPVPVDHNYGGSDNLSYYVPATTTGIVGADVKVFLTSDYNANRRSNDYVVARTTTGAGGRWSSPVMLSPGAYTLLFYKQGVYGPNTATITVP